MTDQQIKQFESEMKSFKNNAPQAPKSAKWNNGVYITNTTEFGVVWVIKSDNGTWYTEDDNGYYMQSYNTKSQALNELV